MYIPYLDNSSNDRLLRDIRELSIAAVTIDQHLCDPKIKKVLSEWYYIFNDRVRIRSGNRIELNPDYKDRSWYYGKRISVQAIVGPNGSGKSSLLELIYRIINNFSALVERGMKRNAAWRLLFVEGLYAELFYVQDGHLYCISCRGNEVLLIKDGEKELLLSANTNRYSHGYERRFRVKDMVRMAEQLHYSVVTNYSLQSLVSADYQDEISLAPDKSGVFAPELERSAWISHLYHKNDGYLTPIVLNPFRDYNGNIDMNTEHRLTIYRLSALFLYYRKRKGLFDGYELNDITYSFSPQIVYDKFNDDDNLISKLRQQAWNIEAFVDQNPNSTPAVILKEFGFGDLRLDNDLARVGAVYIVYKVLSIASKYPSYSDFERWSIKSFAKTVITKEEKESLIRLVAQTKKDKSHITIKVVQVRNFLNIIRNFGPQVLEKDFFGIDYYQKLVETSVVNGTSEIINIMYTLPPSFFIPTLTIKNPDKNIEPIEVSRLSSGERQLLYTFSTYVYHIRNLLSIPKKRVAYRHINLILDEAEICFHPEYQRLFLSKLLYMIKSLKLNRHCAFNIIIATHSPFILSDMPKEKILYLDDGKAQNREMFISPLAANISDILYQSFFLRNGFIGEWARGKINQLLKKKVLWSQLTGEEMDFIESIGDEYLKKQVKRHFMYEEER